MQELKLIIPTIPAKNLIRGCLKTDPAERMTIKQIMTHKWVTHFNKNPTVPLDTCKVLREEQQNWGEMAVSRGDKIQDLMSKFQDTMAKQLAMMRVNDDIQIKNLNHTSNPLLEKRKNRVKPAPTWSTSVEHLISVYTYLCAVLCWGYINVFEVVF